MVLEKTLESPLDCKEIQPVHPNGDQSWVFIGGTDAEAETPILWPRAGRILDQLPGTAGSVSEPCSLGPWDAERAEGVGRRRGFALQAAELSREEVQLQRSCFPLLAQHPCDR